MTSRTSKNTRTELGQVAHWKPVQGGKLTGKLKVMHVSEYGDPLRRSAYSVVVGQIHSDEGHENEPLKIFYKKFPGHSKGSVFWNYEINTKGDNAKRWDYSIPVWGYDMTVVGSDSISYPPEPKDGIELGETFSYEVNVHDGVMYLTFTSEGHETIKFTKSLIKSEFAQHTDIPKQVMDHYAPLNRDGIERENAYADELNYFKQGAYNQCRASAPGEVDHSIAKQYANGCYAEVWFLEGSLGAGTSPE